MTLRVALDEPLFAYMPDSRHFQRVDSQSCFDTMPNQGRVAAPALLLLFVCLRLSDSGCFLVRWLRRPALTGGKGPRRRETLRSKASCREGSFRGDAPPPPSERRSLVLDAPSQKEQRLGGRSRNGLQQGRRLLVTGLPGIALFVETVALAIWQSPASASEQLQPSEADIAVLQRALSSVRKIGAFPSKSSLAEAEALLTESLTRWQALKDAASPSEVAAIFRSRAGVRARSGNLDGALQDMDAALEICKSSRLSDMSVQYEEMPRVLVARADVLALQQLWDRALSDYNFAAELLGDPLEDEELLRARAGVKIRLNQMESAAADYLAAAEVLRSKGRRADAEVEAEHAGIALLGAGQERLADAQDQLCGVIRRSIGLLSEDVAVLQRVIIADADARMAMAAVAWHLGNAEVADTYWRDGCARLDILANDAGGKNLAIGFPDGDIYDCKRYVTDTKWLRDVRHWPDDVIAWKQDFLQNRPKLPPRDAYVQDLMTGRRPGEGSTLMDLAIATDIFRRSDPVADIQVNLQRR
ncbi:unnamed protein product [Polarella glacialis]|uniref:Tetratricopeptide repeat protein n=1 Tax=Polarella glacialis TaxID=89957 RepID=A0A813LDQ8_POLGL|nr:unnamed protein product [Polarella glacialis]